MSHALSLYRNQLSGAHHPGSTSMVRGLINKLTHNAQRTGAIAAHGVHTLRQYGVAGMTGGLLGAIEVEVAGGLEPHGVPVDGSIAIGMAVLGPALAAGYGPEGSKSLAHDATTVGSTAGGIYAYRKTKSLLETKKAQMAGDFGAEDTAEVGSDDPIVAVARRL